VEGEDFSDNADQAILPWTILLSHSNMVIPNQYDSNALIIWDLLPVNNREVGQGSCYISHPYFPDSSRPRMIKDLIALQLANLNHGENKITGQCLGDKRKECFIKIAHESGEYVFGFEIRFKTKQNNILKGSLFCEITP
jgi:hypothetical protein